QGAHTLGATGNAPEPIASVRTAEEWQRTRTGEPAQGVFRRQPPTAEGIGHWPSWSKQQLRPAVSRHCCVKRFRPGRAMQRRPTAESKAHQNVTNFLASSACVAMHPALIA